jgi:hypothetical protein
MVVVPTAGEAAPTAEAACAEHQRRDAVPPNRDLGPSRAEELPMTPRRAGIRSDQATVRAQPEDPAVEPWEGRAVEPRLEIRLEVRMEDQPAEPRQPTRLLLTGSSIPSEAPAAGWDRALDRHRPRTRVLRRVPMSTAVIRDSATTATGVDAEASAFVEATEAMAGAAAVGG